MGACIEREKDDYAYNPVDHARESSFSFSSLSSIDAESTPADNVPKQAVFLNIYDLMLLNYTTSKFGLGIYHTGVEVYGAEYCYSGHVMAERTGLRCTAPQDSSWIEEAIWREKLAVGYTDKTREEIVAIYSQMHSEYLGPSYNVINRNCNHFTKDLLEKILDEDSLKQIGPELLPPKVTRVVRTASKLRVCMPPIFTQDLRDQKRSELEARIKTAELQRKQYLAEKKLREVQDLKQRAARARESQELEEDGLVLDDDDNPPMQAFVSPTIPDPSLADPMDSPVVLYEGGEQNFQSSIPSLRDIFLPDNREYFVGFINYLRKNTSPAPLFLLLAISKYKELCTKSKTQNEVEAEATHVVSMFLDPDTATQKVSIDPQALAILKSHLSSKCDSVLFDSLYDSVVKDLNENMWMDFCSSDAFPSGEQQEDAEQTNEERDEEKSGEEDDREDTDEGKESGEDDGGSTRPFVARLDVAMPELPSLPGIPAIPPSPMAPRLSSIPVLSVTPSPVTHMRSLSSFPVPSLPLPFSPMKYEAKEGEREGEADDSFQSEGHGRTEDFSSQSEGHSRAEGVPQQVGERSPSKYEQEGSPIKVTQELEEGSHIKESL
eukprot:gb/GEZN01004320.1/.p1 GENE.gb/GEZN01004320.1/~~gb/GEZN01004320.1/.p1  ORF type:complete len:606 (-),score=107.29 gb/GEZN01004320.1/:67-1884(-)